MVQDGHTGIEHALPVPHVYKDIVTLFATSGAGYTPTLIVGYGGLNGENYWYQHQDVWANRRLLTFTPRDVIDPAVAPAPDGRGGRLQPRSHRAGRQGDSRRRRRRCSSARTASCRGSARTGSCGCWRRAASRRCRRSQRRPSTARAISGSTRTSARSRPASSPTWWSSTRTRSTDIRNSDSVRLVMVNGRVFDAATMNEIGNHPRTRGALYWERTR